MSSHIEVRHSPRLSTDSDGDIEVPRKPTTNRYVSLAIMHSLETSIADVGLQLWSGLYFYWGAYISFECNFNYYYY